MGLFGRKKHLINKNKTLIDSFKHAYEGIILSIIRERNMHIHVTFAVLVIIFGALFQISYIEWLVCLILIGIVISLELVNTAIETVVDMIVTEENKMAKIAKDTAAGAVLVSAIISAFIGLVIFLPKIFQFLMNL